MEECDFGDAEFLDKFSFEKVQMNTCHFGHTYFEGSMISSQGTFYDWKEVTLNASFLYEAQIETLQLKDCKLSNSFFTKTQMMSVEFNDITFDTCLFLEGEMENVTFENCDMNNMTFEAHNQTNVSYLDTSIKDSVLSAKFRDSDFDSVDFTKTLFTESTFSETNYRQYSFEESSKILEVTEKQFEYFVLSNVIEIRDNETGELVRQSFDPERHHVPAWSLQNIKKSLSDPT